jgi:hypothetical protein
MMINATICPSNDLDVIVILSIWSVRTVTLWNLELHAQSICQVQVTSLLSNSTFTSDFRAVQVLRPPVSLYIFFASCRSLLLVFWQKERRLAPMRR